MSETQEKQHIHRQLTIADIFSLFPEKSQRLAQEITNAGLHCVGCQAATWETLEAGMLGHGFDDAAIDGLIARLNAIIDEEVDRTTITLTEAAARKYLAILASEGKQGWGLRFKEQAGGCNGYEYVLDYSESAGEDDVLYESRGIEIHVPKTLEDRLLGCSIDFLDGLHGSGFKVINPNVKSACGCGNSHGY